MGDQLLEVDGAGGDQPQIDLDEAVGSQRLDLQVLQHAQQLRLQRRRQIADTSMVMRLAWEALRLDPSGIPRAWYRVTGAAYWPAYIAVVRTGPARALPSTRG